MQTTGAEQNAAQTAGAAQTVGMAQNAAQTAGGVQNAAQTAGAAQNGAQTAGAAQLLAWHRMWRRLLARRRMQSRMMAQRIIWHRLLVRRRLLASHRARTERLPGAALRRNITLGALCRPQDMLFFGEISNSCNLVLHYCRTGPCSHCCRRCSDCLCSLQPGRSQWDVAALHATPVQPNKCLVCSPASHQYTMSLPSGK